MGHNNHIGNGNGSDSGTRLGVEIYSGGYRSAMRIYRNGVECLYQDEVEYINKRIATVVSRYREMYRYQLMMSSRYSGGWRVEFDANQIRNIGFKGIDLVYSDLDSLSILFSEELNDVLDNVVKAYEFSECCNDVCGVKSQYVGNEDKRYWEELLDTVVCRITDVLERFYVYYVGLLTSRDVVEYMLQRYDRGLVVGRYHNDLSNGILHMTIDISLYRIQDINVDMVHQYQIDKEVYGDIEITTIDKNLYYLPLVTKDSAKGLCDILEMVAYVNDAMLKYYVDNQMDLSCGDLCGYGSYETIADNFLGVVLNQHDIPDYYEYSGIVFNYGDYADTIEMFIPIERLSTKMMASRVFDISRFVGYYRDMLVECADRFKRS